MGLHVIHLPQRQRDSRGKEVSEARRQAAQLETYPVAIELDGAVEVLDQKTYVADRLQPWVGMEVLTPARMPVGQRPVTVLTWV